MKNLFLIFITLIVLFSCDDWNPERCEIENTCTIHFFNNTNLPAQFAIWVWDEPSAFYLGDSTELSLTGHLEMDHILTTEIWNFGEEVIVENVPIGYTVFVYSDTNDKEAFISQYIKAIKTESCETYTVKIKDITIEDITRY